jgi:hypothetical protein
MYRSNDLTKRLQEDIDRIHLESEEKSTMIVNMVSLLLRVQVWMEEISLDSQGSLGKDGGHLYLNIEEAIEKSTAIDN